jgi:phosphatidylinositol alpha-1,6-mannosyltransferase
VGGVPEIVLQNETGWTIQNSSTNEWVEKINRLVSDPKLSKKIGERGRRWVSEKFNWGRIADQVEKMLCEDC